MGRTVSSYRKTGLFLSFAVVAVYGYLVCAFFPPYQFHKHIIAARMFIQHQLPNGRLVDFSPSYLYLNILMQKWFSDPLPLLRILNIALIGLSVPMLFRILSLFYRHPIALAGTIVFILDYSLIVYAQAFEPEILSKNWKKAWIILALSPICAFSCLPTSLMREEDHLWESTRTSRQLLKSSYARRARIYSAAALGSAGRTETAREEYFRAVKMGEDPVMLEEYFAKIFQNSSDPADETLKCRFENGVVLRQFGYYEKALDMQKNAARRDPSNNAVKQEIRLLESIMGLK